MTAPVRVLLDTSAVIDLPEIDLGAHEEAEPLLSAITIAELAFGLDVDDPVERRARAERYQAILTRYVVVPFDVAAADMYGTLAALVRRSGRNPRPRRLDLQIAATAAAQSIPLLTRDHDGFAGLERVLDVIPV